mmetsp:Transcript_3962/g.9724  ORF Transcript_3962/g.9724 Transcript_3962/m.9724 type:complete len:315 (+) Transcript_3962:95-1039(+)
MMSPCSTACLEALGGGSGGGSGSGGRGIPAGGLPARRGSSGHGSGSGTASSALSTPLGSGGGGAPLGALGSIPRAGRLGGVGPVAGLGGGVLELLLLLLLNALSLIAVEEQVHHDVPGSVAGDLTADAQHLTAQQPPHQTDGVLGLVVGGDGAVHVVQRVVGVAERDGGGVGVGRLLQGLVVGAGVREDEEAGLDELLLDLVGEGSRGEATADGGGAGVVGELQDGALAPGAGGDDAHISLVLHGGDHAGSQHQLLPRLVEVDEVNAVGTPLPHVASHVAVEVAGADVHLARQHLLDILLSGVGSLAVLAHFAR